MKIAPSVLAGDLANIETVLKRIELAKVAYVHWDVMDGHFVPNLTFGPPVVKSARNYTNMPFDVHLMVTNPEDYYPVLREISGIDRVSVHIEVVRHLHRSLAVQREHGWKPAVALNPATPVELVYDLLPVIDVVMLMTVDPGFAGQKFIASGRNRITKLAQWRQELGLKFEIEVDGGVQYSDLTELGDLGVDTCVLGKAFFG